MPRRQQNIRRRARAPEACLQFGVGRRNINPTMPVSLAGYFNLRWWDKILDDLEVRAVVLKSSGHMAALLQFDLVHAPEVLVEAVYRAVAAAGLRGLTPHNMIIAATHTHTAPTINPTGPGANPRYLPFLVQAAVAALQDALADLQPGTLAVGLASEHRLLFNRRYWMRDGSVVTNPGKLNPNIVRPEGEIDPEIPILALTRGGDIRVLITSIVNHGDTIGGNGVSADWPGIFRRSLERRLGAGSMVVPLLGAAGNINHFDVRTRSNQTCYDEAKRLGAAYAAAIAPALSALTPARRINFRVAATELMPSLRVIPPAELAEARALLRKFKNIPDAEKCGTLTSEDLAKKSPVALKYFARGIVRLARKTTVIPFRLVGISFGDAVIASLPGEPFVEIGLQLRKSIFGGKTALVTELANGGGRSDWLSCYIPNAWNYGRGGYETTIRSNPFAPDTAEHLLAAWRQLAVKL